MMNFMKHLRKFNESIEYYTSIDWNEYEQLSDKIINVEDKVFDKLSKLLGENSVECGIIQKIYMGCKVDPNTNKLLKVDYGVTIRLEKEKTLLILQLEDEWFITRLYIPKKGSNQSLYNKCDQIEGLLKFLKEFIKIESLNESFTKEDYYVKIQRSEFDNIRFNTIRFTDKEKSTLEDKAYDKSYKYNILPISNSRELIRFFKNKSGQMDRSSIRAIYKFEDEWFIIVKYTSDIPNDQDYYKCDGLDGLIMCIDDLF